MPLVDPSGPQWVKDLRTSQERRRPRGIMALVEGLFRIMFGWLR
jgi:hypothetical protein